MVKLTALEIKLVNAMRQNEFQDSLVDGGTWVFTVINNSGIPAKQARGVISSLVQKGLVVAERTTKPDNDQIWFTDTGLTLFDNADGEKCSWGGKLLLKEAEEKGSIIDQATKAKASKTMGVVAFTGMAIGNFPVVAETKTTVTLRTQKGVDLVFDKKTKLQTNAKSPRFANRLV